MVENQVVIKKAEIYVSKVMRTICVVLPLLVASACSSEMICPQTKLNTPSHHVKNGMQFLQMNKINTAMLEFNRAIELDPEYSPAYTGLGIAYGRLGDFKTADRYMEKSRRKALGPERQADVARGWMQLDQMRKNP